MFVLNEIDKILQNVASWGLRGRNAEKMRISLDDIERIDVAKLQVGTKIRYPMSPSSNRFLNQDNNRFKVFDIEEFSEPNENLSSDILFAHMLSSLVLNKLAQIPDRQYPSAKLIICDRPCYDMLMKLKRISLSFRNLRDGIDLKNFIYRSPMNVTAIFLLSDIIDLFNSSPEPIVQVKFQKSSGKRSANYNYPLIRQIFPFLKMSDLVLLMLDKGSFRLGHFDLSANKENHILQSINRFSRSTQLIELHPVTRFIGRPHMIYHNVMLFQPEGVGMDTRMVYDKLPLSHISFIADRLVQLADKLRLDLRSISYRARDPHGQTRVFSQLVAASFNSRQQNTTQPDPRVATRVLVVDRYIDLQAALYHAERYGPFLEQEMPGRLSGGVKTKLRMHTVDELDERLQQDLLSEALGTILRYTMSLKNQPLEVDTAGIHVQRAIPQVNGSLSSVLTTSQSIKRHLDIVKRIYRCLNEGYLLILRLETSLEDVSHQLRALSGSMAPEAQAQLAEKLSRILSAFKQLSITSGGTIKVMDLIRIACIMIDVTNIFAHRRESVEQSGAATKIMRDVRDWIWSKDFKRALVSKSESDSESGDEAVSYIRSIEKLGGYDKISKQYCNHISSLPLERIIERFYSGKLDTNEFPTTSLSKSSNEGAIVVLVVLGSLTPNELSRLKALESTIKTTQNLKDIYILASVLPVNGCVKNYHWGKVGSDSYIARFQAVSNENHPSCQNGLDQTKPLAELWFGSHPSGPSTIVVDDQCIKLDSFLSKQPEFIGTIEQYHKYNKKLPFLFKILSIAQPLSLQAHPDKKLAEVLHKRDPKNYPDSNHKPELAIALTEFEVLCDFRPAKEIVHYMKVLAPFRRLVGGEANYEQYLKNVQQDSEAQKNSLALCFKYLMTTSPETITKEFKSLLSSTEATSMIDKDLLHLIKELDRLYPGDPGTFAPFFLNYFKLVPGQALFLKADKLHAYIKGECIECMACSDNVVRAGLTTKYRDVNTLISMLDYETAKNSHDVLFSGVMRNEDQSLISYAPTDEFKVDKFSINSKNAPNGEYNLPSLSSGSFILIFSGKATARDFIDYKIEHKLRPGSAGFIPPKVGLKLYNIQGAMIIYRSYC